MDVIFPNVPPIMVATNDKIEPIIQVNNKILSEIPINKKIVGYNKNCSYMELLGVVNLTFSINFSALKTPLGPNNSRI